MLNNNISLPKHLYGWLRTEFANNLKSGTAGVIPCCIFGVESIPGRALGFHVLCDNGALISQVPVHGMCWQPDALPMELWACQAWDCFGYWITAVEYAYLRETDFAYVVDRVEYGGTYVCSIDWLDNGWSDAPDQHKHLHLIKLDNGNFALMPNNRVRVNEVSFTDQLFAWDKPPMIESNQLIWYAER